ncbi:MAG: ABC transporter substrate-binding protein, partial [Actinomycetota bacterium]
DRRRPLMIRRAVALILALGLVATPLAAGAQPPPAASLARIGFLWTSSPAGVASYRDAFADGLWQLGYVQGRDVVIEHRYAEDRLDALPRLATELVRFGLNVIVTQGTPAARATKQATSTVPIVMVNVGDPVRAGLVASLSRPGGNVTGLTIVAPELVAKRLELLKEAVPKISRVAILWDAAATTGADLLRDQDNAARALGLRLQVLEIRGPEDFERAFEEARKQRTEALLVLPSPVLNYQRKRLVDLTARYRLPASYQAREFVDAGGFMSYGPDLPDGVRRAAAYVDKILKGTKPGDLPVEQPTTFELVINMKTAKALGLTIPQSLLLRANQVIE